MNIVLPNPDDPIAPTVLRFSDLDIGDLYDYPEYDGLLLPVFQKVSNRKAIHIESQPSEKLLFKESEDTEVILLDATLTIHGPIS